MKCYVMAGAFLACSVFAKTDCRPPPEDQEVSDLYYQMCPKKTPPTDEEGTNTAEEEGNTQQSLKDMAKRKTLSNPFLKYPKKDKLYTRPIQNKPWWEQDGQFRPASKEPSS